MAKLNGRCNNLAGVEGRVTGMVSRVVHVAAWSKLRLGVLKEFPEG